MEFFYDDYADTTMLKAGLETFEYWYGDKNYRERGIVHEIQSEVVNALVADLQGRLDKLEISDYASYHDEWRQGVAAAIRELRELHTEIETTTLSREDMDD